MLVAENLSFHYGHKKLIEQVSLELNRGEVVVIVGPNGAGKSTLLKLLTGYIKPQSGQCFLLNRPLSQWSQSELSKVRTVMRQQASLNFPFSVQEVIGMGRSPYGKRHYHEAVVDVMAQTDCSDLAYQDYRTLSGGEQQRVQLARVLAQLWQPVPSPKLVFLDEPTSALDLYHQQQTLRLLKQLANQQGYSICCILHDLNLAALYADRILLLHHGQIVSQGHPSEVFTQRNIHQWYQVDLDIYPHPTKQHIPQIYLHS